MTFQCAVNILKIVYKHLGSYSNIYQIIKRLTLSFQHGFHDLIFKKNQNPNKHTYHCQAEEYNQNEKYLERIWKVHFVLSQIKNKIHIHIELSNIFLPKQYEVT